MRPVVYAFILFEIYIQVIYDLHLGEHEHFSSFDSSSCSELFYHRFPPYLSIDLGYYDVIVFLLRSISIVRIVHVM